MNRHIRRIPNSRNAHRLIVLVIGIALLAIAQLGGIYASPEVKFADASASGLSIVPASCPSSPHYSGECSGVSACNIAASPSTITPGQTATLSWEALPNPDPQRLAMTYTINNGIGAVNAPGSRGVSPGQTTTYRMTVHYAPQPGVPDYSGAAIPQDANCFAILAVQNGCVANQGQSCSSGPNNCNERNTGAIQCDGSCGATPPPNRISCVSICPNGLDMELYPSCQCPSGRVQSGNSCVCPVGQFLNGGICVNAGCSNGLDISRYPSCTCPNASDQIVNGQCVSTQCVSNQGAACTSAPNSCGMTTSGTIQCNGSCGAATPSNNLCPNTCWDGSTPLNGNCPVCPPGYTQAGNSCVPPPAPEPVAHLQVKPSLVRPGDTTRVIWEWRNVRTCTVTGTNGDRWEDRTTSGMQGVESSPIQSRTTYTLRCTALPGATPSSITEFKTVNIIPRWLEN